MSLPARKLREIVFQLLYGHDLARPEEGDIVPMMADELKVSRSHMRSAYERMKKITDHMNEVDELIRSVSKEYDPERIHKVERNIMRLAVFEIAYDDTIPPKVAIAEAIRLGKKFAAPESISFINAILDGVAKELYPPDSEDDKHQIYFENTE